MLIKWTFCNITNFYACLTTSHEQGIKSFVFNGDMLYSSHYASAHFHIRMLSSVLGKILHSNKWPYTALCYIAIYGWKQIGCSFSHHMIHLACLARHTVYSKNIAYARKTILVEYLFKIIFICWLHSLIFSTETNKYLYLKVDNLWKLVSLSHKITLASSLSSEVIIHSRQLKIHLECIYH